jgi:hypothetical protein
VDQIFTVKNLLEKAWEYNLETHHIFNDFQSAYDGTQRKRKEHMLQLFEDGVLNKIVGPKRDGKRLQNKELFVLYSSMNIIQVIKSRRMRWAGHMACMRDRRGA